MWLGGRHVIQSEEWDVFFGQSHDLLVASTDETLKYYSVEETKLKLKWVKPMEPKATAHRIRRFITPSYIIMSFGARMVCFDKDLVKQKDSDVIGEICGVGGDEFFIVDDRRAFYTNRRRYLQLTRREISSPTKITYALSIDKSCAYKTDEALSAACAEDGTTAIVARNQGTVDFYCPAGQCKGYL